MQFIPLTYGTPLLSMSEDFYRWQCHVETQDIILDFITNYHLFQILIFQQDMLTFYGHKENYNLISPPGCSPSYCTVARAAPHLAPFSQTGDVLTASGGQNDILTYSFIKVIINIISPFCDQTQPFMFSEERSCSCQCEAEFPTFREDTSACVETVQGGYYR